MPALDGMRILDMTQYEAGTSCTQALAWYGADVVKVEPVTGDPGRKVQVGQGDSPYFINWNSNKRSIAIDLAKPAGRELLLSMVPQYDVFVENYGPGRMEKLGLDYEVMKRTNPRIVYARIKGFGMSGPYKDYKSYDMIAHAAAGVFSVCGDPEGPPTWPGITAADAGTGLTMATAILAAYVQQQRTGEGQLIEVSMQEAVSYFMRTRISSAGDWGRAVVPRVGSGNVATTDIYPCSGGGPNDYAYLMAVTSKDFDTMCAVIGKPELVVDERFETDELRVENTSALRAIIEEWMRQRSKWEVMETLGEAGVPCSAVFDTVDLFANEHLKSRGFIHELAHPDHGTIRLLGWAPRMSKSDVPLRRAPLMGEHSNEILAEDLALSAGAIADLRDAGVVS